MAKPLKPQTARRGMDSLTRSGRAILPMLAATFAAVVCVVALVAFQTRSKPVTAVGYQQPPSSDTDFKSQVIQNLLSQRVGRHTLADFNLPDEFLDRLANRILRTSFEESFRVIVQDRPVAEVREHAGSDVGSAASGATTIQTLVHQVDSERLNQWRTVPEGRPVLRGFIAPILARSGDRLLAGPDQLVLQDPVKVKAIEFVGHQLATRGLLDALVAVVDIIGAREFLKPDADAARLLTEVGFPHDLLRHFEQPADSPERDIVRFVAVELVAGRREAVHARLQHVEFKYKASDSAFSGMIENGQHEIQLLRAQLTRGDYWIHELDGGSLHVFRQMLERLPQANALASVQSAHVDQLRKTMASWPADVTRRVTFITEPLIVAQWAQDNGKAGVLNQQPATIVPRYASRGDDGSTFVPGESLLSEGLAVAGHRVIHSPLLFQGGNLLITLHPRTGKRLLVIGEAEIHRNTAMGLSREQTIEAFAAEMAVDHVEVVPAVSFHIDYDVTFRHVDGESIAFVNDTFAAVGVVLHCGVHAMRTRGVIDESAEKALLSMLEQSRHLEFLDSIMRLLRSKTDAHGHYPQSFADTFSTGSADSGVGNLQRFLLAIDLLAMRIANGRHVEDQNWQAYLRSWESLEEDRLELHAQLEAMGFKVVGVPGIADASRSISYLNGIHSPGTYFMPAYGGLYAPLDETARATFERTLGKETMVVPILSSESQRRSGAIHCSFSAYP